MGEFRLTEDELKRVMQRAIELDNTERPGVAIWDLSAIEQMAAEIGVSPAAVRQAWVETSTSGSILPFREHLEDGRPLELVRVVPTSPARVLAQASAWFESAGFEVVRHSDRALLLRRKRKGRSKIGGISQIVLEARPLPAETAQTHVRVALARKRPERQYLNREAIDSARTWALCNGAVVVLSGTVTLVHGLVALPVVLAGGAAVGWRRGRQKLNTVDQAARLEVAGLLDLLEHPHPDALGTGR